MTKPNTIKQGREDFKSTIPPKQKSPSPKKKDNETILARITFCKHELKIHQRSNNVRMIGVKRAEIEHLVKELK